MLCAAGTGRWDRFQSKILHFMAGKDEVAAQRDGALAGKWDIENDCRIGSVTRFAASSDPRAVSGRRRVAWAWHGGVSLWAHEWWLWCGSVVMSQVALRNNPDTLALQNDGDEMVTGSAVLHLKVCVCVLALPQECACGAVFVHSKRHLAAYHCWLSSLPSMRGC